VTFDLKKLDLIELVLLREKRVHPSWTSNSKQYADFAETYRIDLEIDARQKAAKPGDLVAAVDINNYFSARFGVVLLHEHSPLAKKGDSGFTKIIWFNDGTIDWGF
jgi:hypothetical protein